MDLPSGDQQGAPFGLRFSVPFVDLVELREVPCVGAVSPLHHGEMQHEALGMPPLEVGEATPVRRESGVEAVGQRPGRQRRTPGPVGVYKVDLPERIRPFRRMFEYLVHVARHHGQRLAVGRPIVHGILFGYGEALLMAGFDVDDEVFPTRCSRVRVADRGNAPAVGRPGDDDEVVGDLPADAIRRQQPQVWGFPSGLGGAVRQVFAVR